MDILSLLDNAEQDVPLCSALLSAMGGLTADELTDIRLAYPKETYFRNACKKYAKGETATAEKLKKFLTEKDSQLVAKDSEMDSLKAELSKKDFEISVLKVELAKKDSELAKNFEKQLDTQVRNPNALALLDREVELPDRFPGETRDHVLEVIKEARDKSESEGRRRRAQILESVLVANEPNGTLAERRSSVEKVFSENNNIISGTVIEKLNDLSIAHKEGEEYLLASEIILRNF
jgi:hypothetical protein